jgi:hypothetical protein
MVQAELFNLITNAGITPGNNEWSQVFQAVLSLSWQLDVGTTNAIIINPTVPFSGLATGTRLTILPANTNTSGTTINVSSLGAIAIQYPDGSALSGGEIIAGVPVTIYKSSTNWWLPRSPSNSHGSEYFSSSGTFTIPSWISRVWVECWGGGGGGSGSNPGGGSEAVGSSGAGGGYSCGWLNVTPGASITATVGTGGGYAASGGTAGTGGTSSFGALSATGGTGGAAGPGSGGIGSGGTLNIEGQGGTDLDGSIESGGSCDLAVGGSAPRGGMGGNINAAGSGTGPIAPGGGGGANYFVTNGQNGASGGVLVVY